MKRRLIIAAATTVGALALVVIAVWPAAPLWARFGAEPICIHGDLPHLRIVPCQSIGLSATAATPIPLPTPEGQAPIPLIFDDDGSPDGVIALLFFLRNPLYSVEAVTVSPGEAHPALFVQHAARLLALAGRADIPVGAGRESPLEGDNSFPEPWRHASDTFWGINLPPAADPPVPHAAPQLIVDTVNGSAQPVVVFVSGTHTNLAEALRLDPGIRAHIREVLVMGGSAYVEGNIERDWPAIHNRVAEWNIWVDPIAAREVLSSALPLHVVPLDATNRVMWSEADASSWAASGSPEGTLAAQLLRWMLGSSAPGGVYVWDLVAAVVTTDSRTCPEVALALDVVVTPGSEQGRTVVTGQSPNAQFCLTPDAHQVRLRAAAILGR